MLLWETIRIQALLFYDVCLGINPGVAVGMTNKSVALAHLGLYAEAEELFRQALDLDPRDVTAWTNHGLCLSRLGYEPEAFASFETVRQLSVLTGFWISYGDDRNIQKYLFSLIA